MNILKKAHEIVYERVEEKERQYGPFIEGMQRAANIYSGMTGKEMSTDDMYKALIALKLSRQSYNHKEDNILDAIAYLASMNDFLNSKKNL